MSPSTSFSSLSQYLKFRLFIVLSLFTFHLLNAETQNHGEVVIPAALLQIPNPLQADTLGLMLSRVASGEDNKQSSNGILAVIELERGKQTDSYWLSLEIGNSIASDTKSSIGTLYSSTGRKFVFESGKAELFSTLLGPIKAKQPDRSRSEDFRFEVNEDFLSLGLNRLHEFFEAANRYRSLHPDAAMLSYAIQSSPIEDPKLLFPPEVIEVSQLSEASERAFVAGIPALMEFFNIIYQTDGLKDILLKLIPKRKLLGLLNPFAKGGIGFHYGTPQPYQVDASPLQLGLDQVIVIPLVLSIGEEPMLNFQLYATDPIYEWKSSAGIVAASIESIIHPEDRCFIRAFPEKLIRGRLTVPSMEKAETSK